MTELDDERESECKDGVMVGHKAAASLDDEESYGDTDRIEGSIKLDTRP